MRPRALIALMVIVLAGTAAATPREDFVEANKAFREGKFSDALRIYNALVRPHVQLADSNDIVEAYVNLGVCRVETGDDDGAKQEFEKALEIDPNKQLDPLVITNKRAIQLFDDTKADLRVRAEREANARREAEEKDRIRKLRASFIGVQSNIYALTFIPGVGQLQNGDTLKGLLFLGGELGMAAPSIGIWAYLLNKYGIRSDKVPLEEGPRVRRLQQIEIGTGVAFFGLYVWAVVDANLHYKAQVRTQIDESLLPPELRETPAKTAPKKKPKTSFHIMPMLSPNSAGIGIGWEN